MNREISNIRIYQMAKRLLERERESLGRRGLPPKSLQDLVNEAVIKVYGQNVEAK
ncbi:hypothetical protein R83H12_00407 [Fibrobacteria bacterium R8-3-H12]